MHTCNFRKSRRIYHNLNKKYLTFLFTLREVSLYLLVSHIKMTDWLFLVISERPNPTSLSDSSYPSFASTLAGAAVAAGAIEVSAAATETAAMGVAATNADGSARKALTSHNEMGRQSVSTNKTRTHLCPLMGHGCSSWVSRLQTPCRK